MQREKATSAERRQNEQPDAARSAASSSPETSVDSARLTTTLNARALDARPTESGQA